MYAVLVNTFAYNHGMLYLNISRTELISQTVSDMRNGRTTCDTASNGTSFQLRNRNCPHTPVSVSVYQAIMKHTYW